LAVSFYRRVHQYGDDGAFQRGWLIDTGGGSFRLRTNETGQLEVFVSRGDRLLTFNADGVLLTSKIIGSDLSSDFNDNHDVSPGGWKVSVENTLFWPSLIRTDPAGNRKIITRTPLYLWLIMGPLPAWIFLLAGASLFRRSQRMRHADS
jgi:hypothetical protein